jgi:DNA-binding transcriptional MocR family regulator
MPTIHNPMGVVMSDARRAALAAVARTKELWIIEDAANRMLVARPPPPIRHYAPERTFLCASVSKVLSPGLRVAFLVGPRGERDAVGRRIWATHWMVNPIGPEIVSMWLEQGVVDETLRRKRLEAERRQAIAKRVFSRHGVVGHPKALHVWLALPAYWRTDSFCTEAARQNIVVTPSSAFWTRRTPAPHAIRIALGAVDDIVELEDRLRHLAQMAHW